MREPGTRVLIIQDCRDGGTATGQIGTYEGYFPRSIVAVIDGHVVEHEYDDWVNGRVAVDNRVFALNDAGESVLAEGEIVSLIDIVPHFDAIVHSLQEYEEANPEPEFPGLDASDEKWDEYHAALTRWRRGFGTNYWYERMNPRIRLDDGSVIWGIECWWGPAENAPPLEKAQELVEIKKARYRSILVGEEEADDGN